MQHVGPILRGDTSTSCTKRNKGRQRKIHIWTPTYRIILCETTHFYISSTMNPTITKQEGQGSAALHLPSPGHPRHRRCHRHPPPPSLQSR